MTISEEAIKEQSLKKGESVAISRSVYQEMCDKIGTDKITDDEAILVTYGFDISPTPFRKPGLLVTPENREDVQEVLKIANRHRIPVTPMSAGVSQTGLALPSEGGIIIDFRKMSRIWEINTDAWYAVIEPGVTFAQFTSSLAEKGFRCHIPTTPSSARPLQNYLMIPAGSLASKHVDAIISLEVILPDGTIINTGIDAFPAAKPYATYGPFPNVTGLFCASYGTLGVITKGAVRIYPKNESNRVNLTAFDDYASAVHFLKDLIGNNIAEHGIIWNWQCYKTYDISFPPAQEPFIPPELSADVDKPPEDLPYNIVTAFFSGYEEMMVAAEQTCAKVAKKYGGQPVSMEEMKGKSPGAVRAWTEFYGEYHQPKMDHIKKYGLGKYIPFIVKAEPESIIEIEKMAVQRFDDLGVKPICYYSQPYEFSRSMVFRMYTFVNPQDKELLRKVGATVAEMNESVMKKYGATRSRYHTTPANMAQLGGYYQLLRAVKNAVDPNNILNPDLGIF